MSSFAFSCRTKQIAIGKSYNIRTEQGALACAHNTITDEGSHQKSNAGSHKQLL